MFTWLWWLWCVCMGRTLLHEAVQLGDVIHLRNLLTHEHVHINEPDEVGVSSLMWCDVMWCVSVSECGCGLMWWCECGSVLNLSHAISRGYVEEWRRWRITRRTDTDTWCSSKRRTGMYKDLDWSGFADLSQKCLFTFTNIFVTTHFSFILGFCMIWFDSLSPSSSFFTHIFLLLLILIICFKSLFFSLSIFNPFSFWLEQTLCTQEIKCSTKLSIISRK